MNGRSTLDRRADAKLDRRSFLGRAAGGLALPLLLGRTSVAQTPATDRLVLGLVGMGKMMDSHLGWCLATPEVQVVAICDVESIRLDLQRRRIEQAYAARTGAATWKGVETYRDFREIAARDDIDAVIVATPDHWHAVIALEMVKAGKDVYCEKPLTLTVREGRVLSDAVRRYGRVFQTGSQQRSETGFRRACELVRNGRIGPVEKVYVDVGGPPVPCDLPPQPVPEGLDWDMWLGPAPWRPYHASIAPQLQVDPPLESLDEIGTRYGGWANFRAYRDFAGGMMTDWGAHHFDIAQWGLGMDDSGPVEVVPPGDDVSHLTYRYANGVTVERRSYDGKSGVTFFGPGGIIMVNRGYLAADPPELLDAPVGPNDVHLYRSPGHHEDWLNAIRHRSRPICDVEIGHRSATVCHIGNIAYWLNRPLKWDPQRENFEDDPDANRLLQRSMRGPWRLA